ncbi:MULTISPECIES: DUF5008 domain-containing protein [Olivibacter]|uniref:DUF5008 domain-containing protein n=1 Tax=Olivibacter oleidegradans TaxID=760123 RepID=A0ABV6HHU5_9SPHI|nr:MULTISPECIES: DUF5008 domain-containing protein [Olivibacter]MDM8174543.1 DUF5008 domain-containing protein [Olivibacter sp. 47]
MSSTIYKFKVWYTFFFCFFALACTKEAEQFSEPYPDGKAALGITVDRAKTPSPASGLPGIEVNIEAKGLLPHKDQLVFRFNGEQAEIKEVTDAGISVVVPDYASTGITTISVGDVVVFGPEFTVEGKIKIDPTFVATQGANGAVGDILFTNNEKMVIVGGFTNYNNKGIIRPINRIAQAFLDGTYDAGLKSGTGANGYISAITQVNDKYFIGGSFSGYAQRTSNISNLTMLNSNGSVDTMGVHTWRRPDQNDTIQYFPRFNAGFDEGGVNRIYSENGKLLVTGSFRYYVSRQYDKPNFLETRDTIIVDSTEVRQFARLNLDGTLDKTYRFDTGTNKSLTGGNGSIDTYYHQEGLLKGKMLVFGNFNQFDGEPANYILRLNADGTIDRTFNAGGAGFDFQTYYASYNNITHKYVVCGNFRTYNGQSRVAMAMLNDDGTLDEAFVPRVFENGLPRFAKQLSDGLIVVSGTFVKYDGKTRNSFMVLNPDGSLAAGYNAVGTFSGDLYNVFETESADKKRALLLIGSFWQFDSKDAANIIRVLIE